MSEKISAKDLQKKIEFPKDLESEVAVLGSLLMDNSLTDVVRSRLRTMDFFFTQNRLIYEAILEASEAVRSGDPDEAEDFPLVVRRTLRERNQLESAGGNEYLAGIVETVPTAANLEYWLKTVREDSARRHVMIACQQGVHDAATGGKDVRLLFDEIEGRVLRATDLGSSEGPKRAADALEEMWSIIRATGEDWITTPFYDLNRVIGGLRPRDLIILGARTSIGKTALAHQFCIEAAAGQKMPTLLFTSEMGAGIVLTRMCSAMSYVHLRKLNGQQYEHRTSPAEKEAVEAAAEELRRAPLFIEEGERSVFEIRATARRYLRQHELALVVVDYLQQMHAPGENRTQVVGAVSRNLKALAMECQIPVLALCQLRRYEGRDEPTLTDLRESGDLEQDADIVLLLHRPEYHLRPDQITIDIKDVAELVIAKHRNGPTDRIKLRFNGPTVNFQNYELKHEEPEDW